MWCARVVVATACLVGLPSAARAQTPPQPLTLTDALTYSSDHYPALSAALEHVRASTALVGAARAAYLPRLDSIWQSNRATANNVFGQVLPQPVIPSL